MIISSYGYKRFYGYNILDKFFGFIQTITCEWATPVWLFKNLDEEFHFELDVCATKENTKCKKFYTVTDGGVARNWEKVNWMNPPYGREIGRWVERAYGEKLEGNTTVCLLPARTDTEWWHEYCMKADELRFIRGRIYFGGCENAAPFPSVVVVFRGNKKGE